MAKSLLLLFFCCRILAQIGACVCDRILIISRKPTSGYAACKQRPHGRAERGSILPLIHPTRPNPMISANNLSIQFGAKPLFENVSATFGNGNRYGLIGANGCGKSTLMKILAGELEPTAGNVSVEPNARVGQLSQDQFAYEDYRVLDVVMMGYEKFWEVMQERDRIYSLPEMSDEDGILVADLEVEFAEMDGYSAESRAGELLEGIGIPVSQHQGPMSAIAPGWKLRVLLAQALVLRPRRAAARRAHQQPRHQHDPLAGGFPRYQQVDDGHHLA